MISVHDEVSGEAFNALYGDTGFYKFLNNDLTHHGFMYKIGLNIDTRQFAPYDTCSEGGLYFCYETDCHLFWQNFGSKLAYVTIPNDARVYIEPDKFKADKLIINHIRDFENVSDEFWIRILFKDTDISVLQFIKDQTDDICKYAIQQNYSALRFVRDQTDDICRFAIQENSYALQFVRDQTREICIFAVWINGLALQYVINQTDEICRVAIARNGLALQYVKHPTDDMLMTAVQQNGFALQYVNESMQTKKICRLAIEQDFHARLYARYK